MPFPVHQLIEGNPKPVTITPERPLSEAFDLMTKHDFSQLPIVNSTDERILGVVTNDSILRSLALFQVTLSALAVRDAKVGIQTFDQDLDVFEVLDGMRGHYAALITNSDDRLNGILTNFDTAAYFRRRAEDIMLVEDIERMMRELILAAFPNDDGNSPDSRLAAAVKQACAPPRELEQFRKSLAHYLRSCGEPALQMNGEATEAAFAVLVDQSKEAPMFDGLTFSEFTTMLLHKDRWPKYAEVVKVDRDAVYRMLDQVRKIRNKLAHFTGTVSDVEHRHLATCKGWLQTYQPAILDVFPKDSSVEDEQADGAGDSDETSGCSQEEDQRADEGKYAGLTARLKVLPPHKFPNGVRIPFASIEKRIGSALPQFARRHVAWWDNGDESPQARAWLSAGFHVARVDFESEYVVFRRGPQPSNQDKEGVA